MSSGSGATDSGSTRGSPDHATGGAVEPDTGSAGVDVGETSDASSLGLVLGESLGVMAGRAMVSM